MQQAKAAVAALSESDRESVSVVGITLDPEHDDVARLQRMAVGQGVEAPLFRLLTGEPRAVEEILDRLDVTRKRDPETGVIDHSNIFFVVDRDGMIAFRLGIGERQKRWLAEALRRLIAETPRRP